MPRIVDPNLKRDAFVRASWAVIGVEGLEAATLRRVAAQAGCTTGSLTHYFPDRHGLLVASLRGAHKAAAARMRAAGRRAPAGAPRLRAVVMEALPLDEERAREWRVWTAFWGAAASEPVLRRENFRRYGAWRAALRALLKPLIADPADIEAEAGLLIAVIDGLGLQIALRDGDDTRLGDLQGRAVRQIDHYLERFLKGSQACPAPSPSP